MSSADIGPSRRVGRPASSDPLDGRITIRLRRSLIERAYTVAKRNGSTLAPWLRRVVSDRLEGRRRAR